MRNFLRFLHSFEIQAGGKVFIRRFFHNNMCQEPYLEHLKVFRLHVIETICSSFPAIVGTSKSIITKHRFNTSDTSKIVNFFFQFGLTLLSTRNVSMMTSLISM